jgi:hypothetical protein
VSACNAMASNAGITSPSIDSATSKMQETSGASSSQSRERFAARTSATICSSLCNCSTMFTSGFCVACDIGADGSTVARRDGCLFDRARVTFLRSNHRLIEPCRIHAALVRPEERDHNMPRSTLPTVEPWAHVTQWEVIAELGAELDQREPSVVLAFAAIRAVVIAVVNVGECGGFESGEFHARERSAGCLWHPLDNSYSGRAGELLYKGIACLLVSKHRIFDAAGI